jgi:hypothetical protein
MMWSKYRAKKTVIDGICFDSKKEATRYMFLRDSLKRGDISDLQMQVKYVLIPAQYEHDRTGKVCGKIKGRLLERECSYYADFQYRDKDGNLIVEDVKGMRLPAYKIKRKMMLYFHGIRITEV